MNKEQERELSLKERWNELKLENQKLRIKDCAELLKVSELELILTYIDSEDPQVIILKEKPSDIIAQVKNLGYVMALSRNEFCVHERKGVYGELSLMGQMGLIAGEDIDLRIFFSEWKYSLAIIEANTDGNTKRSLQFFNKYGTAIHKIHLNNKSDINAFDDLVENFRFTSEIKLAVEQKIKQEIILNNPIQTEVDGFLQAWSELKDTHEFFGLLRKYNINRLQSMKLAEGKFTKRMKVEDIRILLEKASEKEVSIMVFNYNPGIVQIHTGLVHNIKILSPWVNIMDEEFNLHLREDKISQVWWVNKPTIDGDVQSIEVYDEEDELIVQFFGKRKPGSPESEDWRALLASL